MRKERLPVTNRRLVKSLSEPEFDPLAGRNGPRAGRARQSPRLPPLHRGNTLPRRRQVSGRIRIRRTGSGRTGPRHVPLRGRGAPPSRDRRGSIAIPPPRGPGRRRNAIASDSRRARVRLTAQASRSMLRRPRTLSEGFLMKRMLINAKQSEELRVCARRWTEPPRRGHRDPVSGPEEVEHLQGSNHPGRAESRRRLRRLRREPPRLPPVQGDREGVPSGLRRRRGPPPRGCRKRSPRAGRSSSRSRRRSAETRGRALTTFISLAGRYLVLMANNPGAGGISRRVEGDERAELREALGGPRHPRGNRPDSCAPPGSAAPPKSSRRTSTTCFRCGRRSDARPMSARRPVSSIRRATSSSRALRDNFRKDIQEIVVDTPEVYEQAQEFMSLVMPNSVNRLKLYQDRVPLFSRYQIEGRIEGAFDHTVRLLSGGSIVIDHTEALVSIDINSARATRGSDIEQTALQTNLEAADEIARQLRLRDIGGLIVIDFIDMTPVRNQREVEQRLRDALQMDRARIQIGKISRFGLLEMSRQRLRPSLGESSSQILPALQRPRQHPEYRVARGLRPAAACRRGDEGAHRKGRRRSPGGGGYLSSQREARCAGRDRAQERRGAADRSPIRERILPDYSIERVRSDDRGHASHHRTSYDLATPPSPNVPDAARRPPPPATEPAVRHLPPPAASAPAPAPAPAPAEEKPGLLRRLFSRPIAAVRGESQETGEAAADEPSVSKDVSSQSAHRGRRRSGGGRRGSGSRSESGQRSEEPRRRARTGRRGESGEPGQAAGADRTPRATAAKPAAKRSGSGNAPRTGSGSGNGRRPPPEDGASPPKETDAAAPESNSPSAATPAPATEPTTESPGSPAGSGSGRRPRARRGRRGGRRYRRPASEAASTCTPSGDAVAGAEGSGTAVSPPGAAPASPPASPKVETMPG